MAPEYLCELVSIRKSSRTLGSSSQILLHVAMSRLKSYGHCAFTVIKYTYSLENFKSVLKTNLFKVAFTDK